MAPVPAIQLRGVEVHNLKRVDLDLPYRKLIVFCGLSGSGKSSLALDTLYAEGQRRYIETFSSYTRQFLERLEKPAAERIDGIPAAIAVTARAANRSSRSTVGTTTEINDYLRLLLAKIGQVFCIECGREVRRDTPQSVADFLGALPAGSRYVLAYPLPRPATDDAESVVATLRLEGFTRGVVDGRTLPTEALAEALMQSQEDTWHVVVDRMVAGSTPERRLRDSLETVFRHGGGRATVFVDDERAQAIQPGVATELDGGPWRRIGFSTEMRCDDCGWQAPTPEPRLYSFNSPLGACPECEGFGNVVDVDMDLVVPDGRKTLREGAIAPWNTPSYRHELDELLALAGDYDLPVDLPYERLDERQRQLVVDGVPERNFGGLRGFFAWLVRRKYKMHVRVFLSRWRSYNACPLCQGARLKPEALATRIGGKNLAEISALKIAEASDFFRELPLEPAQRSLGQMMLAQIQARLAYLAQVGLSYLSLDRSLRTLSGGEAQRVALTAALGSSLVNMLYVLDEPSIGLHPQDTALLTDAIRGLRDRGNTVAVVEHEEAIIRAADQVVEVGPESGGRGGRIVFQGTPREMMESASSLTGDFLAGRRGVAAPERRRMPDHGWIRLAGARGNNLKNVSVEFPLGTLCVVTGVSGAGKSTLVQDTLYPALCRRLRKASPRPAPYDDVYGDGQLNDVMLVDQSPLARSPRSNPVTYIKAFDEIRAVFASVPDARTHNYTASHFSFNVDGGRCNACEGDGYIRIDMQFMADVYMRCSQCQGRRYRREILDITYRDRNIADVLDMTVREAFMFFRGQSKVQARLKRLIDVGLEYLRLGQPANTLSGGEAQRLKLAGYLSSAKRGRTLFLLDEPTTGLHFADVVRLLDCFDALLAVGHSLVVVEHNLQLIKSADYLIDLGPGAAEQGGQIVAQGSPEMVARNARSITGRFLAAELGLTSKPARVDSQAAAG